MPWDDSDTLQARFRFLCGARWDEMPRAADAAAGGRVCGHCDRLVFHAKTEEALARYAREGHCVAVTPSVGAPLISVPLEEPRWDARVELSGEGVRLCAGPVIPIGAEAGATGLTLSADLLPLHAELRIGPKGAATLIPRPGAASRVAAVRADWSAVAPVEQPVAIEPGAWLHFGHPESGVSLRFLGARAVAPEPRPPRAPPVPGQHHLPRMPVPGSVAVPRPPPRPDPPSPPRHRSLAIVAVLFALALAGLIAFVR